MAPAHTIRERFPRTPAYPSSTGHRPISRQARPV